MLNSINPGGNDFNNFKFYLYIQFISYGVNIGIFSVVVFWEEEFLRHPPYLCYVIIFL